MKATHLAAQFLVRSRGHDPHRLIEPMVKLLSDKDEAVRRHILGGLSSILYFRFPQELDPANFIRSLQLNLESQNPKIRLICVETISHLPQHGEPLIKLLDEAKMFFKLTHMIK